MAARMGCATGALVMFACAAAAQVRQRRKRRRRRQRRRRHRARATRRLSRTPSLLPGNKPGFIDAFGRWIGELGEQLERRPQGRGRCRQGRGRCGDDRDPRHRRRGGALPGHARDLGARDLSDGAERRARLPRRRRGDLQGARFCVRQQRRFPDRGEMPADRAEPAGPRAAPSARSKATSRARSASRPAGRPSRPPKGLALPAQPCFQSEAIVVLEEGRAHEPACDAARARGGRPSGDGRADRRRQVRHHVPRPGAAHARHAPRRRSPISTSRARAASSRAAGWEAEAHAAASLGDALKSRRTHVGDDADALIALSRHRGDHRGDRRAGGRHPPCARGDRARQAHRHGQRRGRRAGGSAARRARPRRRASSTASPGATSRR